MECSGKVIVWSVTFREMVRRISTTLGGLLTAIPGMSDELLAGFPDMLMITSML
jgi:hypothetical protein